jgi:hypothetical protein
VSGGAGRRRLVALVVLLMVTAPLVVVAVVTGSGGSEGGGLRIERSRVVGAGTPQLVVYVDDLAVNVPGTADGRPTVELECLAADDRAVLKTVHPWPFTDTDQGIYAPHVHEEVTAAEAKRIARCRLNGTEGPLEGRPTSAPPRR